MLSQQSFRMLVAVYVATIVLAGVAYFVGEAYLPEPLRTYEASRFEGDMTAADWIGFAVGAPLLIALFASIGGLWNFRPFARPLFLGVSVVGTLLTGLLGPVVATGWTTAIETASVLVNGVLIGVLYFSPARDYFAKPQPAAIATVPSAVPAR